MTPNICIYHADCLDGIAAATVVHRWLKEQGESVTMVAAAYNTPVPDVSGANVYIVDFSYPLEKLKTLVDSAAHTTLIDHHKTAIENLKDFEHPKLIKFMSLAHSGAMLAWRYFYETQVPPRFIANVQDRDLWKFALGSTDTVCAALVSYEYDVEVWSNFFDDDTYPTLVAEGNALVRNRNKAIAKVSAQPPMWIKIDGHRVPALNCSRDLRSEVGHNLCVIHGAPFSATFQDQDGKRLVSLRSQGFDVAVIAEKFGGGGHAKAAGFSIKQRNIRSLKPSIGHRLRRLGQRIFDFVFKGCF